MRNKKTCDVLGRLKQENEEFKAILSYVVSSRAASWHETLSQKKIMGKKAENIAQW